MDKRSEYTPKGVALAAGYECPGRCDHCNIPFDEIDLSARLPVETALRALRAAKSLGLNSFQFTGGEPTLQGDFMVEAVRKGRRLSMKPHRPPTNCVLGGDPAAAAALFERLRDAGFTAGFRISCDSYHSRIPLESIARFILISSEYFELRRFAIGCCDADEARSRALLEQLAAILTRMGLSARADDKFMRTGRGDIKLGFWAPTRPTWKPLPDEAFRFRAVESEVTEQRFSRYAPITRFGCLGPEGVGYLWVDPTGDVRACCGNGNLFSDSLVIGNLGRETLVEIVERASVDPLIAALARGGPVEVALESGCIEALESTYTHRCELCSRVLADPRVSERFRPGISDH